MKCSDPKFPCQLVRSIHRRTQNGVNRNRDNESKNQCGSLLCERKLGADPTQSILGMTLFRFVCLLKVSSWWKQSDCLTWSALTVIIPLTKSNWFSYTSYLAEKGEPSKSKWMPDPYLETHFQSTSSLSRYSAQLCAPVDCGGFCSRYRCPH